MKQTASGVIETLHGIEVADPYRWLEDGDAPEVRQWIEQEYARTRAALDAIPGRDKLRQRLAPWYDVETVVQARPAGAAKVFYLLSGGGRDQRLLMLWDGAETRVVFDPVAERADGQLAIDWWYPSKDGRYVAYGVSLNGSERSTLRVRDVDTGEDLSEHIPHTRASSVAWLPDCSGFFYTRYPTPGTVPAGEEVYHPSAWFHALGTPVDADRPVFVDRTGPQDHLSLHLDSSGRWLTAILSHGWSETSQYVADVSGDGGEFLPVTSLMGAKSVPIGDIGGRIVIHTDRDAPNGSIVLLDPSNLEALPEVLLPEQEDLVIEDAVIALDRVVVQGLEQGRGVLPVYDLSGHRLGKVPLPVMGQLFSTVGDADSRRVLFGFEGFLQPPMIHLVDVDSMMPAPIRQVELPGEIGPDDVVTEQVWVTSKDGTKVPMAIAHRRDLDRSQPAPAFLTGYGGFAITRGAQFYPAIPAFLADGGVIAGPGLRGGYEFGERWHRDGMLEHKQNVFDDFIASAEWLVEHGYTTPKQLAIGGGSNGGLLVGAALTQRPDLFQAVWCSVPLLDMLRFHRFLIGRLWVPEYGSADDPEQFEWIYRYSPYHNVREGVEYPAVLFTAAESDSRVDPLHARKMTALLQDVVGERPDRPILLRTEVGAGHGAGKSTARRVDEAVDQWSFLRWQLGMEPESSR